MQFARPDSILDSFNTSKMLHWLSYFWTQQLNQPFPSCHTVNESSQVHVLILVLFMVTGTCMISALIRFCYYFLRGLVIEFGVRFHQCANYVLLFWNAQKFDFAEISILVNSKICVRLHNWINEKSTRCNDFVFRLVEMDHTMSLYDCLKEQQEVMAVLSNNDHNINSVKQLQAIWREIKTIRDSQQKQIKKLIRGLLSVGQDYTHRDHSVGL